MSDFCPSIQICLENDDYILDIYTHTASNSLGLRLYNTRIRRINRMYFRSMHLRANECCCCLLCVFQRGRRKTSFRRGWICNFIRNVNGHIYNTSIIVIIIIIIGNNDNVNLSADRGYILMHKCIVRIFCWRIMSPRVRLSIYIHTFINTGLWHGSIFFGVNHYY